MVFHWDSERWKMMLPGRVRHLSDFGCVRSNPKMCEARDCEINVLRRP